MDTIRRRWHTSDKRMCQPAEEVLAVVESPRRVWRTWDQQRDLPVSQEEESVQKSWPSELDNSASERETIRRRWQTLDRLAYQRQEQPFVRHSMRNQSFRIKDVNQNEAVSKAKTNNRGGKYVPPSRPGPPRSPREPRENAPLLRRQLHDSQRAVEALAALLNYCAYDLNAFETPMLKKQLELLRSNNQRVVDNLVSLNSEAKELRRSKTILSEEMCNLSNETIQRLGQYKVHNDALCDRLHSQDVEIQSCKTENEKLHSKLRRIEIDMELLSVENNTLKESLNQNEQKNELLRLENLNLNQELENKCTELERLRFENKDVSEKLRVKEARFSALLAEQEAMREEATKRLTAALSGDHTLVSEVESLRQVLALKTEEVTELRRQQLHLQVETDRVPNLLSQITSLEAKVEDLQAQNEAQRDKLRNESKMNERLQEVLKCESAQKVQLSHRTEELQYKLQLTQEAIKLIKKREGAVDSVSLTNSPRKQEENRTQMVGVVQKSDSVSYMLDVGNDSEDILANIIGKLESPRSQTLPKKKRAKTLPSVDRWEENGAVERQSSTATPRRPTASLARVKLTYEDFVTDTIEVPREADCDVVEISRSFDRQDFIMSCSTSSTSSSSYDIESEVYAESPVMAEESMNGLEETPTQMNIHSLEETAPAPILESDCEDGSFVSACSKTPLLLAGEAMISEH